MIEYPYGEQSMTDEPLSDKALIAIARIVRGVAELEDILTLLISFVLRTDPAASHLLTRKMALSRKRDLLLEVSHLNDAPVKDLLQEVFLGSVFRQCLHVRNAVAHGIYMGTVHDGFAFLTDAGAETAESETARKVLVWRETDLEGVAQAVESLISDAEHNYIGLKEIRAGRRSGSVTHSSKARKPNAKRAASNSDKK